MSHTLLQAIYEKFEPTYLSDIFATGFALQHWSRDFLSLIKQKNQKWRRIVGDSGRGKERSNLRL